MRQPWNLPFQHQLSIFPLKASPLLLYLLRIKLPFYFSLGPTWKFFQTKPPKTFPSHPRRSCPSFIYNSFCRDAFDLKCCFQHFWNKMVFFSFWWQNQGPLGLVNKSLILSRIVNIFDKIIRLQSDNYKIKYSLLKIILNRVIILLTYFITRNVILVLNFGLNCT